jgi:hypothetical protein
MASVNSKQGTVDGNYSTFLINPSTGATFPIPMYTRMKFIAGGYIDVAGITDEADVILYQPIPAVGSWANCRFINRGGTVYGLVATGITITASGPVYSAANGTISNVVSTGHLIGRSISDGTAGNPFVWVPKGEDSITS